MKMNLNRKNLGFTLIELLVVVAIIGILASVVLASLNSARSKGGDAAVKSNLSGIRTQAEVLYNQHGCYTNSAAGTCVTGNPAAFAVAACPTTQGSVRLLEDSTIMAQVAAAKSAGGGLTSCISSDRGTSWAVAVHLQTPLKAWCVDSNGVSREVAAANTQVALNAKISTGACAAN